MDNSKTVDALNDLLQISNDRVQGFQNVDKKTIESYSGLSGDYDHMVEQSVGMRAELSSLVRERGGDPDNSTTVAGSLHRTWIDLKNSFSGDRDESTLENVTFGEKAAIEAYEKALESGDLCKESAQVVQDQLQKIKTSYAKFSSLEKTVD